jgi:hypothetical protein
MADLTPPVSDKVRFYFSKSTLFRVTHADGARGPSIFDRIDRISKNAELFDEEKAAPPAYVFAEAKRIVAETNARLNFIPDASISVFYDELNITWQNGDSIVRLTCFPDWQSVIQTGRASVAGSYRSISGGSIILADKLKEMCGDIVVTEETISG